MKYIFISELQAEEYIKIFFEKENLGDYLPEYYIHPQEDYFAISENPPVFVVADGVTLDFKRIIKNKKTYPNPSPSREVAKIFCESFVKKVSHYWSELDLKKITQIFKEANSDVAKYNKRVGKSEISGNMTGFYSATGAFLVIKNQKAYWGSICDSFIAHFDNLMNLKFISSGNCSPYAVINGEEKMVEYLKSGILDLNYKDRLFVFTDGFRYYFENSDFLKIFKYWDDNIKNKIFDFSKKVILKDPDKYGHERSLIAILI